MKPGETLVEHTSVSIPAGDVMLQGDLSMPSSPKGIVLFAHGSGSSRHSPRNRYVAEVLNEHSLGTLLVDLLTAEEEQEDEVTAHLRFDIDLLTRRLVAITDWLASPASGPRAWDRAVRSKHGRGGGADDRSRATGSGEGRGIPRRSARLGRLDCLVGSCSNPADCWRQGHGGHSNESRCNGANEMQNRAQDCPGCDSSI